MSSGYFSINFELTINRFAKIDWALIENFISESWVIDTAKSAFSWLTKFSELSNSEKVTLRFFCLIRLSITDKINWYFRLDLILVEIDVDIHFLIAEIDPELLVLINGEEFEGIIVKANVMVVSSATDDDEKLIYL